MRDELSLKIERLTGSRDLKMGLFFCILLITVDWALLGDGNFVSHPFTDLKKKNTTCIDSADKFALAKLPQLQ